MRSGLLAAAAVAALVWAMPSARAVIYRDDTGSGNPGAPTADGSGSATTDYTTLLNSNAAYQSVGTFTAQNVFGIGGGVLFRTPSGPASSQYILTAAHLINGDSPSQVTWTPYGTTDTYVGTAITTATNTDLAIVKLDRVVTEVAPVTIYTGSSEVGKVGTFVGVGYGGSGATGRTGDQGTLRAGQNSIDFKGSYTQNSTSVTFNSSSSGPYLFTDFDKPGDTSYSTFGSGVPLTLEAGVTYGDSGGGLFADFSGQTYLVGITDEVFTNASAGGPGVYGDIDDFIDVSLDQALIGSAVPEPASLGLIGMAGVVLLGRRRKRC